jgi:hypothetical protein
MNGELNVPNPALGPFVPLQFSLSPMRLLVIALEAVAAVNETIDKMGSTGEHNAFNRAIRSRARSTRGSGISTRSMRGKRRCWNSCSSARGMRSNGGRRAEFAERLAGHIAVLKNPVYLLLQC